MSFIFQSRITTRKSGYPFFGTLRAEVSLVVAGHSVMLDNCAATLGGVEVNITDTNSHLDEHAAELAQEALNRGLQLVQAIKTAA